MTCIQRFYIPQDPAAKFQVPSTLQVNVCAPVTVYPVSHVTVAVVTEPSVSKLMFLPSVVANDSHDTATKKIKNKKIIFVTL